MRSSLIICLLAGVAHADGFKPPHAPVESYTLTTSSPTLSGTWTFLIPPIGTGGGGGGGGGSSTTIITVVGQSSVTIPITSGHNYRIDYRLFHEGAQNKLNLTANSDTSAIYNSATQIDSSNGGGSANGNTADASFVVEINLGSVSGQLHTGNFSVFTPQNGSNGASISGLFGSHAGAAGVNLISIHGNWEWPGISPITTLDINVEGGDTVSGKVAVTDLTGGS